MLRNASNEAGGPSAGRRCANALRRALISRVAVAWERTPPGGRLPSIRVVETSRIRAFDRSAQEAGEETLPPERHAAPALPAPAPLAPVAAFAIPGFATLLGPTAREAAFPPPPALEQLRDEALDRVERRD